MMLSKLIEQLLLSKFKRMAIRHQRIIVSFSICCDAQLHRNVDSEKQL